MALIIALALLAQPAAPPDPVEVHRNNVTRAMERMREGDTLLRQDDLKGACDAYQDTVKLLPTWWMPHLALVRCGRFVGMPLETLKEHAEFAARARPRLPITHYLLGLVLEEAGDEDQAVAAYETALRHNARRFEVRYRLGVLLARRGEHQRARAQLEYVLDVRPNHIVALSHLAGTYETLGLLAQAESALGRLTQRSRFPALALSRLVRFFTKHGMTKKAERAKKAWQSRFSPREDPLPDGKKR